LGKLARWPSNRAVRDILAHSSSAVAAGRLDRSVSLAESLTVYLLEEPVSLAAPVAAEHPEIPVTVDGHAEVTAVLQVGLRVIHGFGEGIRQVDDKRGNGLLCRVTVGYDLQPTWHHVAVPGRVRKAVCLPRSPGELDSFEAKPGHCASVSLHLVPVRVVLGTGSGGPNVDWQADAAGARALARLGQKRDTGGDHPLLRPDETMVGLSQGERPHRCECGEARDRRHL
jgi:hypothetical protein